MIAPAFLVALSALPAVQMPAPSVAGLVPAGSMAAIARYRAGAATCEGAEPGVLLAEEPFPSGLWVRPGEEPSGWEVRLTFAIDASGRPHAIHMASSGSPATDDSDVPAAFAAWRFARGSPRGDCQIVFRAEPVRVGQANPETLHRYLVFRRVSPSRGASVASQAFRRVQPSGTACADGGLAGERSVAYPDWRGIGQPAGTVAYAYLRGDVNAEGVPERVRILTSSGNSELDRRSIDAVDRSRYPVGARRDCVFFYAVWRETPLEAPRPPAMQGFREPDTRCGDASSLWVRPPRPAHPPAFKARRIEGWAIVRYDLSPAGRILNPAIRASEPAVPFGEAALASLVTSEARRSESGYQGCIERFEFPLASAKSGKSSQSKPDP
jgi:hypothetical protein